MIVASNRIAKRYSSLATTGILILTLGSTNTVPGEVRFSVDIRSVEDNTLMKMEAEMQNLFQIIARGGRSTQAC